MGRYSFSDIRVMLRRLGFAITIGILAALAVALFRLAMITLERLLLGDFNGSLVHAAAALDPVRRVLTPALGGLAAGSLLWMWQRYTRQRPHAPADYMEAIDTGDGRLDVPSCLVKSLASLLVVVSGSAIGREGAMILLATLAASVFAQKLARPNEWKLWVACGAAAGMASAYHAPLAGSLFIAEILFGTLVLASLGPVVISAVTALLVTHAISPGNVTLYQVIQLPVPSPGLYLAITLCGLVSGFAGPLFLWLMTASNRLFLALRLAPPLQLALGGLCVGGLSLITPLVWGNGYSVVQSFLSAPPAMSLLAGILVWKLLAIIASSGSGAPGGVFTPTLFAGVASGMLLGQLISIALGLGPDFILVMGLTGMAALLAATTHAPIMATLMVCEMTGEYSLLPGLLVACVIGSVVSRALHPDSIYRQHLATKQATQPAAQKG
ncbi:putative chloride channel protein ClcB-like [Salmonella enterica subsp. enterica serovar Choleraesuis]|nr:putative chloride channel protein ClcB-like [Salmonella enterica subsp. enterica serovar Choleraesuis]